MANSSPAAQKKNNK